MGSVPRRLTFITKDEAVLTTPRLFSGRGTTGRRLHNGALTGISKELK